MNFGLFLARVPLGLYFGMSGLNTVKCGLSTFVAGNMSTAQHYLPEAVARGYLNALPFAEILVGALLLLGLFTRIGAFLGALILGSFVLAMGMQVSSSTPPFNAAIVPLGLTLALLTVGPGKLSADMMLFKRKPAGGGGGDKKH